MTSEEAIKLVAEDVSALESAFAPVHDDEGDGFTPVTSEVLRNADETVFGVQWTYRCQHVGKFLGMRPMHRLLTIKGMTVVYGGGETPELRRYVDWAYVASQLGIASSMQPLVEDLSHVYPTS